MKPQHHILDAFTELTPATPFLVLLFISIFAKLDHHFKLTKKYVTKTKLIGINKKLKTLNHLIEPNFYDALNNCDRRLLITKEEELNRDYGISRLNDNQEKNFMDARPAHKMIIGLAMYDILYN